MKKSELTRKLKAAGCYWVCDLSRHESWYSPITGKSFTVPRHMSQDVPKGTLHSIKKQSGVNI